ncbi:MAG: hypothetical protein OHK0039_24790 [Bacteroidia bacterium]
MLVAATLYACTPSEKGVHGLQHVIVIGVDGMSPDGIRQAHTPNLDKLMRQGASTLRARTVLPSSSSPNWASMIMGAGPELHGITSNAWERDDHILPPAVQAEEGLFPTIFSVLHAQRPDVEIGAIYHWGGFGRLFQKSAVDHDRHYKTQDSTAAAASTYLREQKPAFCFIHFDEVDHVGHQDGHGTPAYYRSIEHVDSLIGMLLHTLEDAYMIEQSLILVTADHGGVGYGHGGESLEEMEIPFILYGRGIKPGYEIRRSVMTFDQAPTLAYAMGLQTPDAWIGRPIRSAFAGQPDDAGAYLAFPYEPRPLLQPAGGLYPDSLPTVQIESRAARGQVHYTLDGSQPDPRAAVYTAAFKPLDGQVLRAAIFDGERQVSVETTASYRLLPRGKYVGVRYTCYPGRELTKLPPEQDWGNPIATGTAPEFSLEHIELPQPEQILARFDAWLDIATAGSYQFYLASDDGSKLYIDGTLVVDNDGDHGVIERSGRTDLTTGKHRLRVDWFNGGGGSALSLAYEGPGISKQVVPASRLTWQ